MPTKSKLERAVERRAESLNDAQRELVLSQLSVYRRNMARLARVESELDAANSRQARSLDEVRAKQSLRATLSHEVNQLATANSRIAAELNEFLKE